MYPNPTSGVLYVEGELEGGLKGDIQVFDLRGQQVLFRLLSDGGSFRESIDLEGLVSGACLVMVRTQGGRILAREVVIIGD